MMARRYRHRRFRVKSRRMESLWRVLAIVMIAAAAVCAYMIIKDSVNYLVNPVDINTIPIGLSLSL
ncbi:MAG: hypothetical protein IJC48_03470 [Clostridia bacterium]|nr:hypothetical protein [Clostridia bacterium]MBQ4157319.1 hypothetical protein [Clostridia bacterium]